jgi:DNA-binding NtrC family response regulator
VIAATNQDLEEAIARGEFRADLYYRLDVVEISVPPLRERPEEIPALAAEFLARFNAHYGRAKQISPVAIARLTGYSWPGNVRELENAIRRFVVLDRDSSLDAMIGGAPDAPGAVAGPAPDSLREIARRGAREAECRVIQDVLDGVGWNRAEAARVLKVGYKTLRNKLAEYRLRPPARA